MTMTDRNGMNGLVDIAGNLTNKAFREDLSAVLARAVKAGVSGVVVAGVSTTTSRRGWEMAMDLRGSSVHSPAPVLVATAGIHPHHASQASPEALDEIAELARREHVVAVGECGLDYNRKFSAPDAQRKAFEAQLEIAAELKKPVYLHERDAHEDFARILERWRSKLVKGAVVHCFTGTRSILDRYLEMDLHIGFTGWLCDERRGKHLLDIVRQVPRGRMMVETDCPYILPRDLPSHERPRDGRNEPAFVVHVAKAIARERGESFEDLTAHTTRTARDFFGF